MIKGEQFTVDVRYLVVSCLNRTVLATSRSIYYGLEDCYWQSISVLNPHSVLERVSLQIFTSVLFAKKNTLGLGAVFIAILCPCDNSFSSILIKYLFCFFA